MSNLTGPVSPDCRGRLHPKALAGLELFHTRRYFEAHESLEAAWRQETSPIRELYRGILQIAVVYLHLTHYNFDGVVKVYQRSRRWLQPWPEPCRGIAVGQLRRDAEAVLSEVQKLDPERLDSFDFSLLKPVGYVVE